MENKVMPVPEVTHISEAQFKADYLEKNEPLVIRDGISHWPALEKWTQEYLRQTVGFNQVEVETSEDRFNGGLSTDPEIINISFSEFLERFSRPEGANDYYVGGWLFPALIADAPGHNLSKMFRLFYKRRLLMSRGGNRVPQHYDWYENLLCQVSGTKEMFLADPSSTADFYPPFGTVMRNFSPVSTEHPNYEKYPRFRNVPLYHTIIRSGDMIYIPARWWHDVISRERNIAVSYSFYDNDPELLVVIQKLLRGGVFEVSGEQQTELSSILESPQPPAARIKKVKAFAKAHGIKRLRVVFAPRSSMAFE